MMDNVSSKRDRIDQQAGDDKEARDKQGPPEELQLGPRRILLYRSIDRQPRQKRANNTRQVYFVGNGACQRHDNQHHQEMGLLVTPQLAQCIGAGATEPDQDQRHKDGNLDQLNG